MTADHLLRFGGFLFDDAARTLEVTTQRIRQNPDSSLSRNASTNDRAVRYQRVLLGLFDETFGTTVWLGYLASNEVQCELMGDSTQSVDASTVTGEPTSMRLD